jgi:hypothetical protein
VDRATILKEKSLVKRRKLELLNKRKYQTSSAFMLEQSKRGLTCVEYGQSMDRTMVIERGTLLFPALGNSFTVLPPASDVSFNKDLEHNIAQAT